MAVTCIRSEDEIPADTMRPSAMGQEMCICQAMAAARAWGARVTIAAGGNFCVPSSAGHKWVEVTDEAFIQNGEQGLRTNAPGKRSGKTPGKTH